MLTPRQHSTAQALSATCTAGVCNARSTPCSNNSAKSVNSDYCIRPTAIIASPVCSGSSQP